MKAFAYPARIAQAPDGSFEVQFLDLDEAFTYGAGEAEALENASEVLSGILESYLEHDREIPEPTANAADARYVLPDAKTQAALAFRAALRESVGAKTVAEVARAVETSWPSIARLEDPTHWPTLRLLEKAVRATGRRLVVAIE